MLKRAIPVLHVTDAAAAERFYCDMLGFRCLFTSRTGAAQAEPCYTGLARDAAILHISSFPGDAVAGGVANVLADDVDALYAEFAAKGVAVAMPPTDQTWGSRELYVRDPDGNVVRFVRPDPAATVSLLTPALTTQATALLQALRDRHLKLATAESCTGGLIAAVLTEIAGSSDVVERGFVTYSNEAKSEMLGVPAELIAEHGAVSEPVARAMAQGALAHTRADVTVAVTGVAGPGGGTPTKPVGLVHIAAVRKGGDAVHQECRFGSISRGSIRVASVEVGLQLISRVAGIAEP